MLLQLNKVNKSFGAVQVLHDVDFSVRAGEVTALVGDNGAGKSTLVKCVAGIHPIDGGEILFEDQPVAIHGPTDASALGIEVVYQDLALADNLDIVQNMFLGRERGKPWLLDEADMEQAARRTLASLSVRTVTSVRMPVAALSGGQRQTVAIAKAVLWDSKVVLLDEPTAALGVAQTRQVLDLVRRLAEQGLGVVLISHNMADVFEVSDRIACLYLGRMVAQVPTRDVNARPDRRADHRRPLGRPRSRPAREREHLMATHRTPEGGAVPPTDPGPDEPGSTQIDTQSDIRSAPRGSARDGARAGTPAAGAVSAAERAAPAASRAADFGIDTTTKTTGEAIRAYVQNLRNGDLGSLPALLGLLALFVLFTVLDSGGTFPSLLNLANLLQQGAGQTVIAMGLVFVLLIGEIDLAAGTASGLAAAVLALHQVSNGNLLGAMGNTVFVAFVAIMALAVALAVWLRIWAGAAFGAPGAGTDPCGLPAERLVRNAARRLRGRGDRRADRLPGREARHAVVRRHSRAVHLLAGRDPPAHRRRRNAGPA